MRLLQVLLIALLVAPVASAQSEFEFSHDYHARVGFGDIPTTDVVEADGLVHAVEYVRFVHDGNMTSFTIPEHAARGCDCGSYSYNDGAVTVDSTVPAGSYVFWVRTQSEAGATFDVTLPWLASHAQDAQIVVYAPTGMDVTAPVASATPLACTDAPCTIYSYEGDLSGFWATVHPAISTPAAPTVEDAGFGYLELVVGILAGALIWFWLVQKGFVQARTRKQVVAKAAHQEVAATESKDMLTARKRVLMAGLKELEMAKMKAEVDDGTYDVLKTELKKETVTTMRALESAE